MTRYKVIGSSAAMVGDPNGEWVHVSDLSRLINEVIDSRTSVVGAMIPSDWIPCRFNGGLLFDRLRDSVGVLVAADGVSVYRTGASKVPIDKDVATVIAVAIREHAIIFGAQEPKR